MKAQHLFSKLPAEIQFFLKKRLHVLNIYIFMRKCKCFFVRRHKISCFLKNNDFRVLHLGCGRYSIKKGEVFNSDLSFENFIDVLKPLPFPDNSIDVVFHEHLFEHLDFPFQTLSFLKECRRVLKKNGVLRFSMPDFDKYVDAYLHNELETAFKYGANFKETYEMEVMNFLFKQRNEHKFIYNFRSASHLLKTTGFGTINRQDFNVSSIAEWKYDRWNDKLTMYIEAFK